jgi:hypothetical protein
MIRELRSCSILKLDVYPKRSIYSRGRGPWNKKKHSGKDKDQLMGEDPPSNKTPQKIKEEK